ncbi:MAG: CRISPR system precrRNA processing endoribonuclease RAMP protein Cas6 [bacterium]
MYPYAIYAIECMAQTGLGHGRHRFRLARVDWQQNDTAASETPPGRRRQKLYDGQAGRLVTNATPQTLPPANGATLDGRACLRFLTPTRLKFRNELTVEFTFRMLVFKMLRRVLELAHFHMPGADIDWEFHDLLVAADGLQITDRNLAWSDWQRRSNRQKTSMKMGGFVGSMTLAGALAPFAGLLHTCERVHVGKAAVFGNGKIKVEAGQARCEPGAKMKESPDSVLV